MVACSLCQLKKEKAGLTLRYEKEINTTQVWFQRTGASHLCKVEWLVDILIF